jgi:hypothetical protein
MTQAHLLDRVIGDRRPDLSTDALLRQFEATPYDERVAARSTAIRHEIDWPRRELNTKGLGGDAGPLEVTDAACVRPAQNGPNPTHQESAA